MKTPELTPLDPDYYPRIKHNGRWYLIVPEMDGEGAYNYHYGCAFECRAADSSCKLIEKHGGDSSDVPLFKRHDCGDNSTIFVAPSKFPEYRAHLVANKLEGKP
jgi:hypothetical protein